MHGWARKLSLDNFRWVEEIYELNKDFLKSYNDDSHEGYFVEASAQYLDNLLFLPKRKKIEKIKKFVAKFHDKTEYVVHIRNLKQTLNHTLVLKKWHRIIKFNQKILEKKQWSQKKNNDFEKDFFKLKNDAVFGNAMENWENIGTLNLKQ